jgi:NADPH:quinone reductase-like Zn-dependent oxidoreductase
VKAAIVRRYGPAASVELADVPDLRPGPGQLLVRVHAASINPLDAKLRAGALRWFMPLKFPAILGFDFAGVVEALGVEVSGWSEGDAVYGRTDARTGGTHAELAVVRASVVDRMPPALSFEEAASLPLVGMTAIQALEQVALVDGERLLVNGAAGGVGSAAVQVGRAMGARVTGVCNTQAAPLVAGLGARVLDYTKGELAATKESFDVILDTVFNTPTEELEYALEERGRYITTGFSPWLLLRSVLGGPANWRRFRFVISRADGHLMRALSDMVMAGQLVPIIDSVVPFARIAEAHSRMEQGHTRGKIVITMRE